MSNNPARPLDDALVFMEESRAETPLANEAWKVLIVDDEPDVHHVTTMVLKNFTYQQKGLKLLSAYSGTEAMTLLTSHPDIALILLDVVMEEQDSGLKVVKFIRDVLRNKQVRIILRTGQAGLAPESKVIVEYDINDYKEKTELTSQKLYSALVVALRTYCDIDTIEANRRGLQQIIAAAPTLFTHRSMQMLASGILTQITSLLRLDASAIFYQTSGLPHDHVNDNVIVLAATGDFVSYIGADLAHIPDKKLVEIISTSGPTGLSALGTGHGYIFRMHFKKDNEYSTLLQDHSPPNGSNFRTEASIYFRCHSPLNEVDRKIVAVYLTNVTAAFDNLHLNKEIEDTLTDIIFSLGEVIERRSHETGNHVRRVSEYCYHLALALKIDVHEAEHVRLASVLHDVGKVGVCDQIMNKPGPLTPKEFNEIKQHTDIGHNMLRSSNRVVMKTAGIIAYQHHEKFDGTGYPQGLKGEDIHIYGRICALADVFDALSHDRIYKKAWEIDKVIKYLKDLSGRQFDPRVVDAFERILDVILDIRNKHMD